MAFCTVSDIDTAVQALCSDTSGEVFTTSVIQPYRNKHIRALYRALNLEQVQKTQREYYYDVPANTSVLDPATAGISNLGDIEGIDERGNVSSTAITNVVVSGSAATVTSTSHGRSTGQSVVVYGVGGLSDDVNDIWTVTVSNANTLLLNGCTASGTYTSGGKVSYSTDTFIPMHMVDRLLDYPSTPQERLERFTTRGDLIRFFPASSVRQIRITCTVSGAPPSSGTIPIDDCLDFVAHATAADCIASKGATARGNELRGQAYGPKFFQDGTIGGLLYELIAGQVRSMQDEVGLQRPPYRRRRNLATIY